jgi:hypothetical protein
MNGRPPTLPSASISREVIDGVTNVAATRAIQPK